MSNPHEERARAKKAGHIAAVLAASGATADEAERLDPAGRHAAEQLAVVNPASAETWAQVVKILRDTEIARAEVARDTNDGADPFLGICP